MKIFKTLRNALKYTEKKQSDSNAAAPTIILVLISVNSSVPGFLPCH